MLRKSRELIRSMKLCCPKSKMRIIFRRLTFRNFSLTFRKISKKLARIYQMISRSIRLPRSFKNWKVKRFRGRGTTGTSNCSMLTSRSVTSNTRRSRETTNKVPKWLLNKKRISSSGALNRRRDNLSSWIKNRNC